MVFKNLDQSICTSHHSHIYAPITAFVTFTQYTFAGAPRTLTWQCHLKQRSVFPLGIYRGTTPSIGSLPTFKIINKYITLFILFNILLIFVFEYNLHLHVPSDFFMYDLFFNDILVKCIVIINIYKLCFQSFEKHDQQYTFHNKINK